MKRTVILSSIFAIVFVLILAIGLHACGWQYHSQPPKQLTAYPLARQTAYADHAELSEISGIVKSETYNDVYWVHNDSGNKPRIFAIDRYANIILPEAHPTNSSVIKDWPGVTVTKADNKDWEDIAIHEGKIYLADMGNNRNARKDLGIYIFNEPNPYQDASTNSTVFIPIRYPDQQKFPAQKRHFDNEAFFISEGGLYFLTKHRPGPFSFKMAPGSKLYRLDSLDPDKQNTLTLISEHPEVTAASAADISPDGNKLAVLTYTEIWVFEKPKDGSDDWLSGRASRIPISLKQTEAITWIDNEILIFTNEQREFFELSLKGFL